MSEPLCGAHRYPRPLELRTIDSGAQSAEASRRNLTRRRARQPGAPPERGGAGLTPQLLRAEVDAGRGATGGPLHRHLRQEERFIVQEGTVKIRQGLRGSRLVGPGEKLAVPAGTPHTFEVVGDRARFVTEFRPAHRVGAFFRELFALAIEGRLDRRGNPRPTDLAVLMQRYPEDFFYLPVIPPAVQRALARPLARVQRNERP